MDRRIRKVWAAVIGVGVLLGVWLPGISLAQQLCDGITDPKARAQCVIGGIQSQGLMNPSAFGAIQSQLPGFSPALPTATEHFTTSGNPDSLNAAGQDAVATDPMAARLRDMQMNTNAFSLQQSSPLATARQVLAQPRDPLTQQACRAVQVCVREVSTGDTVTCEEPATQLNECSRTQRVITDVVPPEFRPVSSSSSWSWPSASSTWSIQVASYDAPNNRFWLCGQYYYFYKGVIIDVSPRCGWAPEGVPFSFTLAAHAQANSGCCFTQVYSLTVSGQLSGGFGTVTFTGEGGSPSQTLPVTYRPLSYTEQWLTQDGKPMPVCSVTWPGGSDPGCNVVKDACLDAGGTRSFTATDGSTVAITKDCWNKVTYQACDTIPDTCEIYKTQSCDQLTSACGQVDSQGRCAWYRNTFACRNGSNCAQWTTIQQCNSCGGPASVVPFCTDPSTSPNRNLQQTASFLEMLQQVRRDYDPTNFKIFTGVARTCQMSGLGDMLGNCCTIDPTGDTRLAGQIIGTGTSVGLTGVSTLNIPGLLTPTIEALTESAYGVPGAGVAAQSAVDAMLSGISELGGSAAEVSAAIANLDAALAAADLASGLMSAGIGLIASQLVSHVISDTFGAQCTMDDQLLAAERKAGTAHYVATRCSSTVNLGFAKVCAKREEVWCSFRSVLARLVQEGGRPQVGPAWAYIADGEIHPRCDGFTLEQFTRINFEQINFQEFYDRVHVDLDAALMQQEITNQVSRLQGGP